MNCVQLYFDTLLISLDTILSDLLNMDTVAINAAGSVYFSQGYEDQVCFLACQLTKDYLIKFLNLGSN